MKKFTDINDLKDLNTAIDEAIALKKNPRAHIALGEGKTVGLLFFNKSLRTRLSTQKAANNLGMDVMVMNFGDEAWNLEYEDGTIMETIRSEHVKEAAKVMSQYCDIICIRAFAGLENKAEDQAEPVLTNFIKYADAPIVNLESATGHPLQALADAITLKEQNTKKRPKVVLSWAPHPKALPHAVANSFIEMIRHQDADFCITNPEGYDLDPEKTKGIEIYHNQEEALKDADFVYVKNWCSFEDYGKVNIATREWMMTKEKLGDAQFMHCLPIRRNIVAEDAVLDSDQSLVIEQANNRTYSAQYVLKSLLENL